jgi:hypothetical protein
MLLAAALLLGSLPADAATYYVAPWGNDANPGTSAQPWQRPRESAWRLRPGDTLLLKPGTYQLNDTIYFGLNHSGTPTGRKTVAAEDPNNRPVIAGTTRNCVIINGDWIEIRNLVCTNRSDTGIAVVGGQNIRLIGNQVMWNRRNGIGVYNLGGRKALNIHIEGNGTGWSSAAARTNGGGWPQGLGAFGESQTVVGNVSYHNWGEGIDVGGRYNLVDRNTIFNNMSVNLYLDNASYTTVRRNLIYDTSRQTGDTRWYMSTDGGRTWIPSTGIQLGNEGTAGNPDPLRNLLIENNIVLNLRNNLFYWNYGVGGGVRYSTIRHNTFVDSEREAIFWGPGPHVGNNITDNIFKSSYGSLAYVPNRSGLNFARNLWSRSTPGIPAGNGDVIGDPRLVGPAGQRSANAARLTSASPAINRGAGSGFPTVSYFNVARIAPADIGADEFR